MNVLHLINNLKREGAQMMVLNLATAATGARHIVCTRTPRGGPLRRRFADRGVAVYAPESYAGTLAVRRTLRFIEAVVEREDVDLIHAHMADAAFPGWLAARRMSLPLIITHHGYAIVPPCHLACRSAFRLLLGLASRHAQRNVAVSATVASRLRQVLFLDDARVDVIDNGVPLPDFGVTDRQRPLSEPILIVSVGRLEEIKGQRQLIAAAARLERRYPTARYVLVGDGPMRPQLEREVTSAGLSDRFHFTGSVDDVASWLRQASVYVSTSHFEGLPVAVLEAMAWCVPVVASDVPGNTTVVSHDKTGLTYALNNVDDLADVITRTLADPESALRRAQAARSIVEDQYSIEITRRRYEEIYSLALNRGAAAPSIGDTERRSRGQSMR